MKSLHNQLKSGRLVPIFFLSLCVLSLVMVVVLNGKKTQDLKEKEEVARFEVFNFEYYRIGTQGVSVVALGKKARENVKGMNELEHFSVTNFIFPSQESLRKEKVSGQENLQSSFALYNNQEIFFPQGVNYQRNETKFWSQIAQYNPDTKELKGEGEFIVLDENYKIRGQNIAYRENKIYAKNIYGILKAKE
ncbi:MAG: hypothetical protein K2N75_03855 [Helicobacter sp.]|uniref:hypothetical protein n=1 Tax=Helicobacter sp. TaxID=218 RepID=UPI0023C42B32|nr:hypothetical protein [Helicobacter sp.]MDE5925757.1 hypothetical protein [Helicobacter sp.]MDE7175168.1 hypothetical protein [Helicobacter sp.]